MVLMRRYKLVSGFIYEYVENLGKVEIFLMNFIIIFGLVMLDVYRDN